MTNWIFWSPCTFHALATAETFLHCALLPYFCALLAVHRVHFCNILCSSAAGCAVHFCSAAGCAIFVHFCSGPAGCAVHFCSAAGCALFCAILQRGVQCTFLHFSRTYVRCSLFTVCTSAVGCALLHGGVQLCCALLQRGVQCTFVALPTILGVAVLLAWGPLPALTSLSRAKLFWDKKF